MTPHEKSEISPTVKPPTQSHTPSQVFKLILAAQKGSAEACMELSRCFEEGDGVQPSEVTACAWLLLAASNGSAEAEKEFEFLRSRLSPEEIQEAEAQANEYFYSSDAVGYPEAWYDEFNLVICMVSVMVFGRIARKPPVCFVKRPSRDRRRVSVL